MLLKNILSSYKGLGTNKKKTRNTLLTYPTQGKFGGNLY